MRVSKRSILIKKCHRCGHIEESRSEPKKCSNCKLSFLPSNYMNKKSQSKSSDYNLLFDECDELEEKDLVKGIQVLWN